MLRETDDSIQIDSLIRKSDDLISVEASLKLKSGESVTS